MNDLIGKIAVHKAEGWWAEIVEVGSTTVFLSTMKAVPLSTFYEDFDVFKTEHLVAAFYDMRSYLENQYRVLYGSMGMDTDGLRSILVKWGAEVEKIEVEEDGDDN